MLDYAANGSAFWTADELRNWFEGDDHDGATDRLVAWLDPRHMSLTAPPTHSGRLSEPI
jgi:hypothetical protein